MAAGILYLEVKVLCAYAVVFYGSPCLFIGGVFKTLFYAVDVVLVLNIEFLRQKARQIGHGKVLQLCKVIGFYGIHQRIVHAL